MGSSVCWRVHPLDGVRCWYQISLGHSTNQPLFDLLASFPVIYCHTFSSFRNSITKDSQQVQHTPWWLYLRCATTPFYWIYKSCYFRGNWFICPIWNEMNLKCSNVMKSYSLYHRSLKKYIFNITTNIKKY